MTMAFRGSRALVALMALSGMWTTVPAQDVVPTPTTATALVPAIPAAPEASGTPIQPAPAVLPAGRPERTSGADPAVPLAHHAWPVRFSFPLPYGEPRFEAFLAAYRTPGGRKWLEAVYERSRPYASYVLGRLRFYGAPEELFFLPFIESEYSPKVVSRSGAVGLWQFMRNSVAGYDMRIDDWVDERRDFMKSTDAAIRKLLSNYARFGDWLLAVAAYNCGAGAMDRAIAAGGVRDYWALRDKGLLPPETASYIPKFLAVASLAMHGGRNGLTPSWTGMVDWVAIPLDRPVDIGLLATASGVPEDELRLGNPELRYGVTPPEGRYSLKVPVARESAVRAALASNDRLMNVYLHVVRTGDTVSAIARHYEVTVAMIAKMNPGLVPDRIRVGQVIAVPAFGEHAPYPGAHANDPVPAFDGTHVVKKGETIWSLSLVYGVQPETLAERNGLDMTSVLREGATLIVPILN